MDDPLYDVWRIADADGPVLLLPAPGGSDEDEQLQRVRSGDVDAEGVVQGVWQRTRPRLAQGRLTAEVVDVEVPERNVVQRVATLAGADDACGWVPPAMLVAPEPAPRRPRKKAAATPPSAVSLTRKRPTATPKASAAKRPARARKAATTPTREPAPAVAPELCRRCFILRDPSQLTDGVCTDGCD